jgi:hypothetical protein
MVIRQCAQWLFCLDGINIHGKDDFSFRRACEDGNLALAQWLYGLGGVNIHTDNDLPFQNAFKNGHLQVVQWLFRWSQY